MNRTIENLTAHIINAEKTTISVMQFFKKNETKPLKYLYCEGQK